MSELGDVFRLASEQDREDGAGLLRKRMGDTRWYKEDRRRTQLGRQGIETDMVVQGMNAQDVSDQVRKQK